MHEYYRDVPLQLSAQTTSDAPLPSEILLQLVINSPRADTCAAKLPLLWVPNERSKCEIISHRLHLSISINGQVGVLLRYMPVAPANGKRLHSLDTDPAHLFDCNKPSDSFSGRYGLWSLGPTELSHKFDREACCCLSSMTEESELKLLFLSHQHMLFRAKLCW